MTGGSELLKAEWKKLTTLWQTTEQSWRDEKRAKFESRYWQPLAQQVKLMEKEFAAIRAELTKLKRACP